MAANPDYPRIIRAGGNTRGPRGADYLLTSLLRMSKTISKQLVIVWTQHFVLGPYLAFHGTGVLQKKNGPPCET